MFSMLKGLKDAVLSGLGRLLINKWGIAKYGAVTSLALDSKKKTISFSLTLKGEKELIHVEEHYRVEKQSGTSVLLIDSAHCSREWANLAFNDFVSPEKRRIPLPPLANVLL